MFSNAEPTGDEKNEEKKTTKQRLSLFKLLLEPKTGFYQLSLLIKKSGEVAMHLALPKLPPIYVTLTFVFW